ncbi:hypothetical protein [Salisediminibacterium halotolerans]|uniref:Copper resistance protein D n=1 Tax=Salisediminibacterium halotolerans TaxID=517425 RepID=A0A1H9SXV9_9BACI|nr:hypothetical protein [Salisediminibacterium haloalkalitolerans]SER89862.1 hypothetical protein SAMN05444126_10865 [Salisediminibacterium haloalkalitolerans]
MYSLMYILHIAGVALWLGSFAAFGYLLRSLVSSENSLDTYTSVVNKIRIWINAGVLPGAVLVMLTGVFMILQFDRANLPFYLLFMEQAGSIIILFTVIVLSVYSRKLKKKLNGEQLKKEKTLESLSLMYTNYLFTSAALGLVIVIITGMRVT